ncbi:hypothetical protein BDW69DRAFT_186677 [Aspergillus filifer]
MQFKLSAIAALASVAAATPVLNARDTTCAANAVTAINALTEESQNIAKSVANLNANTIVIEVPKILQSTVQEVRTMSTGVGLPCEGELTEAEQQQICDATGRLISAEEDLVKAFSSRKNLIGSFGLGAPVSAVALDLEGADQLVFQIADSTPVCGKSLQDLENTLGKDIQDLIEQYGL